MISHAVITCLLSLSFYFLLEIFHFLFPLFFVPTAGWLGCGLWDSSPWGNDSHRFYMCVCVRIARAKNNRPSLMGVLVLPLIMWHARCWPLGKLDSSWRFFFNISQIGDPSSQSPEFGNFLEHITKMGECAIRKLYGGPSSALLTGS